MRKIIQKHLLIIFGWLCIILALLGVILPLLPTTPFLIAALVFFSKSSPRFHQMLLNNKKFGPVLRQWEETRTMSRQTKYRASILIILSFSITLAVFHDNQQYQLLLATMACVLLFFVWRVREDGERGE